MPFLESMLSCHDVNISNGLPFRICLPCGCILAKSVKTSAVIVSCTKKLFIEICLKMFRGKLKRWKRNSIFPSISPRDISKGFKSNHHNTNSNIKPKNSHLRKYLQKIFCILQNLFEQIYELEVYLNLLLRETSPTPCHPT